MTLRRHPLVAQRSRPHSVRRNALTTEDITKIIYIRAILPSVGSATARSQPMIPFQTPRLGSPSAHPLAQRVSFSGMNKGATAPSHHIPPPPMSPVTRGMARKGIRHYAPYNLRSRGRNQTLLDLSTLPSTPRTPVHPCNIDGARAAVPGPHVHAVAGNLTADGNEFIYPDIQKAIRDGVPPEAVGFGVKLKFIQDCFELVKTVNEEQKKTLRALEGDEVASQEKLVMFEQRSLDYVKRCTDIAMDVMADEMMNNLLPADGVASTSST
ncbi:hypothetical protein EDD15DRAFT_2359240 [Pisolithus albus]|nr:hypothetical protein EDD15DRAFT_2359240 [Pisolithus albus]